jgi:hypothetical protein
MAEPPVARTRDPKIEGLMTRLMPLIDPAFRLATVILGETGAAETAVCRAASRAAARLEDRAASEYFDAWFLSLVARAAWAQRPPATIPGEVGDLTPEQRAVLFLQYWLGLPAEDIGRVLRSSARGVDALAEEAEDRLQRVVPVHERLDRRTFHRHVVRAFDETTPAAPYGFERTVFAALLEPAPPEPGPGRWLLPVAVVFIAAAMITLLAVAAIGASAIFRGRPAPPAPSAAVPVASTPEVSPSPSPSPSPLPSPSPQPAAAPPSACTISPPPLASPAQPVGIADVRAGIHPALDRLVVQFAGPVPPFELKQQAGTTFAQDPSGQPVAVAGTSGWLLVVHGAYQVSGVAADLKPGYPVLNEARNVGDSEGTVRWALGVNSPTTCPSVYLLTGPNRLVIDFPR